MTQGELERIALPFIQAMLNLESRIMTDLVNRLKKNKDITSTVNWEMDRLREMGVSKEYIEQKVQEALGESYKEIDKMFESTLEDIYRDAVLDFTKSKELSMLIDSVKSQTKEEFKNLTRSLGFAIKDRAGKIMKVPMMDFYRDSLDSAVYDIASGAFSYDNVLRHTVKLMTNSGLRSIDYDSGYSNRIDVAVRRAVMTGFRQVTGKMNEQLAEKLGTDYYEVTYHIGARPTHQKWQGRVWSYEELQTVCGLGDIAGLCGANCYHWYMPFVKGTSVRSYTDGQLKQMIAAENEVRAYKGKYYNMYEGLQKQRQLETVMRKQRQDINLLTIGGADRKMIIDAKAKYRGTMQEYVGLSKALNLPQQKERIYLDGLGRLG